MPNLTWGPECRCSSLSCSPSLIPSPHYPILSIFPIPPGPPKGWEGWGKHRYYILRCVVYNIYGGRDKGGVGWEFCPGYFILSHNSHPNATIRKVYTSFMLLREQTAGIHSISKGPPSKH